MHDPSRTRMTDEEKEVLAANAAFYAAFCEKNVRLMTDLWAEDAPVACIHPGWPPLFGRANVLASWMGILSNPEAPRIHCREPRVVSINGHTAFVVCLEQLDAGCLLATNSFVREAGGWRLVHHHAGPAPECLARVAEEDDPGPDTLH